MVGGGLGFTALSLYMSGCIYRSMLMSVGTDGGEPKGETFREKKEKKKGRERGVRYKTTRVQHDLAIPCPPPAHSLTATLRR
jgi:hypothetical protein